MESVSGQISYRGSSDRAICASVSLKAVENSPGLVDELKGHLAKKIGATGPMKLFSSLSFPRCAAARSCAGCYAISLTGARWDTTTLADPTVVAKLKERYEEE